jgi:DNA-binding transcriptional LysR family regulator
MMNGRAMLDADLLRAFLAVAERGGFTRAARSLNRTQSAVSMQVKRLEGAVGARLFARRGRAVQLTPEGDSLVGYARRIVTLNEEAMQSLARTDVAGTVRLGAIDDYATRVLPPLLARFSRDHPGIMVELETGLTAHMLPRLGTDYDLVLAMHPAGTGGGLVLRRDRPVWAAPRSSRIHKQSPLPLALYPSGCLFRRWAIAALDDAGRPWRCVYMSPSLGAVEAAVAAGLAVSVFKASTVSRRLRRLGRRDGFPELPPVDIAVHRRAGDLPRAVAAFADFLIASFRRN